MTLLRTRRLTVAASALAATALLAGCGGAGTTSESDQSDAADAGTGDGGRIVVASVNNGPMVTLQEMAPEFTAKTGIEVEFVMLTENDIRSKIQQDVAVGSGQFDVVTIGTTDAAPYLEAGWVEPLQPMLDGMTEEEAEAYDFGDIIPAIVPAYSSQTEGLAALPFYGESTMVMYRTDLFDEAGLTMPDEPSWDDIYEMAVALNDPGSGTVGMAMRGKAGYGENMYIFNTFMNAYGGQIANMDWVAQYDTPEMAEAWEMYKKIQQDAGAPDASTNGYTETLNLMSSGNAGIYFDATVSADVFESDDSAVKGKMGYAMAPSGPGKGNTQAVGGWGVAVTSSSQNKDAAFDFITWATSREYVELVAADKGWLGVPTGARTSTYLNENYRELAPYAELVLQSLENVDFEHPAVGETPYVGNTLPNIPEWAGLGERLGQILSEYISSDMATDTALTQAQDAAVQAVRDGGRTE